jgi:drug/metabolite transporter (DMT)-like permease
VKALLAVALGVTVTSWGAILVRLAAVPPLGAAFYRMAFAAALLAPAALLARAPGAGPGRDEARAPGARRHRTMVLMILSGACLTLHFATWIASLSYTSIASSVVLVSTVPIFGLAMSAVFLGERAGVSTTAAILVAFGGAAAIGSGDYSAGSGRLGGDLLALAGAFFAAAYLLIGRRLRDRVPLLRYLLWVYGSSAGFLLIAALAAGASLGPYRPLSFLWLFLMALGPSVVGHSLLNYAVRHVRAYVVNAAGLGEPVLATAYAFVIFGERPGPSLYAGGSLVAAGLIGVLLLERRRLATRA